jgi:hypothetical protein
MYFSDLTAVDTQMAAVDAFWTAIASLIAEEFDYAIRTEGRELNDSTGVLEDFYAATGGPYTGGGSSAAQQVPDASQGLVRWLTSNVIAGRRLQGRTFIPGLTQTNISEGNLGTAAQGTITTAAQALVDSEAGLMIWHRPQGGTGGTTAFVTTASVWNELAVLRRRRG